MGRCTFEVSAADSAGKSVGVDAMIQGEVTGVNYRDGVTYLSVGNREIAFSDVVSVKNEHELTPGIRPGKPGGL